MRAVAARRARPLIGVTGPDSRLPLAWWCTRLAVSLAGGRACRLTPSRPQPPAALAGVIIGGGDDIDPDLYAGLDDGKAKHDPARDRFEMQVLRQALAEGLPILGICRGAQLLNVALGGNLHQDLREIRVHTSNRRTVLARKSVLVERESLLHHITGGERYKVNSLHHQGIRRLGHRLRVAARDLDEIVQAIEDSGRVFVQGVQWHPEYLLYQARQRRIFGALVAAARERLAARRPAPTRAT